MSFICILRCNSGSQSGGATLTQQHLWSSSFSALTSKMHQMTSSPSNSWRIAHLFMKTWITYCGRQPTCLHLYCKWLHPLTSVPLLTMPVYLHWILMSSLWAKVWMVLLCSVSLLWVFFLTMFLFWLFPAWTCPQVCWRQHHQCWWSSHVYGHWQVFCQAPSETQQGNRQDVKWMLQIFLH